MPAPLTHITPNTPMGANLLPDGSGATFRVWAPCALRVHLISEHSDWEPKAEDLLTRDAMGYWAGFWPGFKDGFRYKFHVFGPGGDVPKRDPHPYPFPFDVRTVTHNGLGAKIEAPLFKAGKAWVAKRSFWRTPYLCSSKGANPNSPSVARHARWRDSEEARPGELQLLSGWIKRRTKNMVFGEHDLRPRRNSACPWSASPAAASKQGRSNGSHRAETSAAARWRLNKL